MEQLEIGQGQIRVAQIQVDTSEAMAQSVINAERAWVMADLNWVRSGLHIAEHTSASQTEGRVETTVASLLVMCKNEGKSPAWIDNVSAYMEIIGTQPRELPRRDQMQSFGSVGPLGAGKERPRALQLSCSGHRRDNEVLSVYVLIEYHDIFNVNRETHLGYTIFDSDNMGREDSLPECNRNT